MKIETNQPAPSFTALDQNGKSHSLSDYKGKWVLLYFYPQDDTSGCTKEACAIRDNFSGFNKLDAVVLGVSPDSVDSHTKFADKYNLPFTLLADEDKQVINAYGVWGPKSFLGKSYEGVVRMSFLIDPQGKIAKVYEKVKPAEHAEQVLEDLQQLRTG